MSLPKELPVSTFDTGKHSVFVLQKESALEGFVPMERDTPRSRGPKGGICLGFRRLRFNGWSPKNF